MGEVSAWMEPPGPITREAPDEPVAVHVDLIDGHLDRWTFRYDRFPAPEDQLAEPADPVWRVGKPDGSTEVRPAAATSLRQSFEAIATEMLGSEIAARALEDLDQEP